MTDRRAMIAKIHVAKKQMDLDDDSYRAILVRVTGHTSAKDCSDADLERLLAEFKRQGFKPVSTPSGKPHVRLIYALWQRLKPFLDAPTDATLAAFVQKQTRSQRAPMGIVKPEWLNAESAKPVIEGLKGWLDREQAKKAKAAS